MDKQYSNTIVEYLKERKLYMKLTDMKCTEFITELKGPAPVPGGGGASALVGAIGMSLGNMVGSLTVGKKKYQDVSDKIKSLMEKAENIIEELISLVDKDAEAFEPLSKAYGLPKGEERDIIMEDALKRASEVPLIIMEKCCEAIEIIEGFAKYGSIIALSDAGVAAVCAKAALTGAALNIYINAKSMKNRDFADAINEKADSMIKEYGNRADKVYEEVAERIR